MAGYEQIMTALRNADAAGDTAAATRLAQMAREAKAAQPQAAPTPQAPERGLGHRLYDNIVGDPTDGVQSTGEALGTWLNRSGESATFGVVGDEASGAVYAPIKRALGNADATYASERDRFRKNEANMSTGARLSADLFGALVPGTGFAGAVGRSAGLAGKVARGSGAGAATGGIYGFMEGEGEGRARNALAGAGIGGVLGGMIPVIGHGIGKAVKGRQIDKAMAGAGAPSTAQLKDAGRAAYQAVDDAGVQIKPSAFDRLRTESLDSLRNNTGYDELPGVGVTPRTARVMQTMDEASAAMAADPTSALPFRALDQARKRAGAAAGDFSNKTEQQAGTTLIGKIDDFVQSLGPDDVVGGDVAALKSGIGKAREIWGRMRRSEMIDNAIDQSGNYLSGGASGVRNQLAHILRNKKLSASFSDTEREVLRRVINGGFLEQAVHMAGGRLGQTVTTGLSAGLGGAFSGGLGGLAGTMAGAAIAGGARNASNALAMSGIERARGAIASGVLNDPQVMNRLAVAGRLPELMSNITGGALNALAVRQ